MKDTLQRTPRISCTRIRNSSLYMYNSKVHTYTDSYYYYRMYMHVYLSKTYFFELCTCFVEQLQRDLAVLELRRLPNRGTRKSTLSNSDIMAHSIVKEDRFVSPAHNLLCLQ